jgi:hypothetical protein
MLDDYERLYGMNITEGTLADGKAACGGGNRQRGQVKFTVFLDAFLTRFREK